MIYFFRKRKEREIETVRTMIAMYCKAHHHPEEDLCEECAGIFSYASMKYHRCLFGEDKPVCTVCPVHCYTKEYREKIRKIMRYSGPRMILHHPLMAIDHLLLEHWSKKNLPRFLQRVNSGKKKNGKRRSA
jgi:hypothetical protein